MKNWYLLCIRTCAFLCELILQTVRIWLITYAPMCAFTLEKCLYYLTEKKMNKAELIEAVASTTGLTKTDTKKTIDAVFEEITNSLKKGEPVQLIGFGSFKVSERNVQIPL